MKSSGLAVLPESKRLGNLDTDTSLFHAPLGLLVAGAQLRKMCEAIQFRNSGFYLSTHCPIEFWKIVGRHLFIA